MSPSHAALRQPLTPLPLDPRLPQQLHAYAERQMATAAGQAALAALDLDRPEILAAYRPGFLPGDYRHALRDDQRRMLLGRDLGGCIVLPAFDAQGSVVDLVAMKPRSNHVVPTLWEAPRGVCAPVLATASERLCVTTVARWVGRLFREIGPTALIRDLSMVATDAARFAAGGVQTVEVRCRLSSEAEILAAALQAGGIEARIVTDEAMVRAYTIGRTAALAARRSSATAPEAAAPAVAAVPVPSASAVLVPAAIAVPLPADLVLVRHDAKAESAVFQRGEAVYAVQVPWGGRSTVAITLTLGAASHRDRFDLAVAPQRLRFAAAASHRVHLPPADIARDLERLLPMLLRLVEVKPAEPVTTTATVPGLTAAEHATALALLRAPDLLPTLVVQLDALGAGLPADAMAWTLLAAVSRLAAEPVWLTLTSADPAERFSAIDVLGRITPPEAQLHLSRLTDAALFHGDADGLRHKLLLLDDLAPLTPAAATALRVLHTRGRLTTSHVQRDAVRGRMRTRILAADGPIAVVSACVGAVPEALRHQLVALPVAADPGQRACDLRRRFAPPVAADAVIRGLHQLQRLLAPAAVIIPETLPLDLPPIIVRDRTLHEAVVGLIAASALLHQHQRLRLDGAVVATTADVAVAVRLALGIAGARSLGLSPGAQQLMQALTAAGCSTFTMEDCAAALPTWTRWAFRTALDELARLDLVAPGRTGQGKQRTYALLAPQLGGLAALGGAVPPSVTREVVNG